jgi:hypothetical protein
LLSVKRTCAPLQAGKGGNASLNTGGVFGDKLSELRRIFIKANRVKFFD